MASVSQIAQARRTICRTLDLNTPTQVRTQVDFRSMTLHTRSFLVMLPVLGALLALVAAAEPADAAQCLGHHATIVGSLKANHIEGTDHKDVIAARAGNDVIDGHLGGDIVCGGAGSDRII